MPHFEAQPRRASAVRPPERVTRARVCVIGAGVIGSLFAGHLAAGRRRQPADAPPRARGRARTRDGLRITRPQRASRARDGDAPTRTSSQPFDLGIVATKATGLEAAAGALEGRFPEATIDARPQRPRRRGGVRAHGDWPIVSAVTFMSGTQHDDTHVEYVLDTETWLGPYEDTPYERVEEIGRADRRVGAEGRGAAGSPAGAVVEADLQRDRQLRRRR